MAGNTYAGKNLRIRVGGRTIFHATECSFATSRNMESIASGVYLDFSAELSVTQV